MIPCIYRLVSCFSRIRYAMPVNNLLYIMNLLNLENQQYHINQLIILVQKMIELA